MNQVLIPRRTAVAALLLALVLAGCSADGGRDAPAEPRRAATSSATEQAGTAGSVPDAQELAPAVTADGAAVTSSNLPAEAALPSGRVPSVQDEPPGRAVLAIASSVDWVGAERKAARVSYLYGEDGSWRALDLVDFGLDLGDVAAADGPVPGQLSPNGRFYAVSTPDEVLIVNLGDGTDRLAKLPDSGRAGLLSWTAWNSVLVAERGLGLKTYELDSLTGRVVNTLEIPANQLGTTPGGRYVRYQPAGDRLSVQSLSPTGGPVSPPVETPFPALPLPGQHSGTEVALWQNDGPEGEGGADALVVADDEDLEPTARLAWPGRANDDWVFGWLRDRSLLLRSDQTLFTWAPDEKRAAKLATIPGGVVASVAMELVAVTAPSP